MEARLAIEPRIAVLAVARATVSDFERMELCNRKGELAESFADFEHWDAALHQAIAESVASLKKLDGVSEDDKKHAEKDLQKLHDDYIHKVDDMAQIAVEDEGPGLPEANAERIFQRFYTQRPAGEAFGPIGFGQPARFPSSR